MQTNLFGPTERTTLGWFITSLQPGEWFVRYVDEEGPFLELVEDVVESIKGRQEYSNVWNENIYVQWNPDKSVALCVAPSPVSITRTQGDEIDPPCSVFLNRRMAFGHHSK